MMRKFTQITGWLAAIWLAASPASATPDTQINIREEPIGVSDTHLFVLRVSTDNLGYYEASRVEMYLIMIDWASGKEHAAVLDRFVNSSDYSDEGDFQGYSIKRDAGLEPADPYELMRKHGAVPWLAVYQPQSRAFPPSITNNPAEISVQFGSSPALQVTRGAIQQQLDRQQAFMVANVADHKRSSTMTTRQHFQYRRVSADTCTPDRLLGYWVTGRSNLPMLLRINCAFDEDSDHTSLVVQLRPALQPQTGQ